MRYLKRLVYVIYRRRPLLFWGIVTALAISLLGGVAGGVMIMSQGEPAASQERRWSEIVHSGTLRAVVVSSSMTAFEYKGRMIGHEYEQGCQVAKSLGLNLEVVFAPDERSLMDSLVAGAADIALHPISSRIIAAHGSLLRPCGYDYQVRQVMVRRMRDVKKGNGKRGVKLCLLEGSAQIVMLEDTTFKRSIPADQYWLVTVPADSVHMERLVDWVMEGSYDCTIIPENMAQLLKTYYPALHVSKPMAYAEDTLSWAVAIGSDTLSMKVDSVCRHNLSAPRYPSIVKRYYEQSLGNDVAIKYLLGGGRLSVYDELYRRYAAQIGWDWRLVAAISFVESRFDPLATSSVGAKGLMQLMPHTAERFGCPSGLMSDPESNVRAGVALLAYLESVMRNKLVRVSTDYSIEEYASADSLLRQRVDEQFLYYVIGGFHAGVGHVFDAMALADTLGYSPTRWDDHVAHCITLKNDPAYYSLPCVNSGRFDGEITVEYVKEVLRTYENFKELVAAD